MREIYTEVDFERYFWHDCHIWGVEFRVGDPERGDWTNDIAFDIDFIVEWIFSEGSDVQFRVAPATLVFHGVTDLQINIDGGHSGFRNDLYEVIIDDVERELVRDQKVHLDRPYYVWKVYLDGLTSGEISFGAVGFTQTLRSEPVLTDRQHLSLKERELFKDQ